MVYLLLICSFIICGYGQISTIDRIQPDKLNLGRVGNCCDNYRVGETLLNCVIDAAKNNRDRIHVKSLFAGNQPSINVGIVTYATSDITNYAVYSFLVNEAYAEHNYYKFWYLNETGPMYDSNDARWNKIKILLDALDPINGWGNNLDYILWVDADMIFLDMSMRIEQIAAAFPHAHMIVSAEHTGSTTLINSGSILVKNSKWARKFLHDWWNFADRKYYSDQEQFDMLYNKYKNKNKYDRNIVILRPDGINSDPPAMTLQRSYNQMLHLMGEHDHYRTKVFSSAFHEICRHYHTNSSFSRLAQQLSISRDNLLRWTVEEYSKEYENLVYEYSIHARNGENTLTKSRKLSNSAHHYAHALMYTQTEHDMNKSNEIRLRVFELLKANVESRRNLSVNLNSNKIEPDWPEHLKVVAEAGQNICSIGLYSDKIRCTKEVMTILQEIILVCHIEQRDSVMLMLSHMNRETGMIELSVQNYTEALAYFELDLVISRKVSFKFGAHVLITPLSLVANVLAMFNHYQKAYKLFAEAVELIENYAGQNHHSLRQPLVNYGIALVTNKEYVKAKPILERVLALNKETYDSAIEIKAQEYLLQVQNQIKI